ncbi:MAG: hypothetical protein KY468_02595 [Armatimonadetes bacterium]|nr:hypothetical protein [Armatimonadota bacterium]
MIFHRKRGILYATLASLLLLAGAVSSQAATSRLERQFLGVRLMSRGNVVLKKYGSPHRVLVANDALLFYQTIRYPKNDFLTISVTPLDAGGGGAPAGPYGPGGSAYNPYTPGGPAAPPPGIESGGGAPQPGGKHVFWVYQYPQKGVTNVFVLDEEGRVVIIGQAGGRRSTTTSRGVGIGSTYSSIVRVYGFPERHEKITTQGAVPLGLLRISYEESHGVEFIFLNQPLRGYGQPGGGGPWCVGVVVKAVG